MAYGTSHQSFFTYNLAKPYPFRWFTPTAVVIFIFATGLFTLLNLAATGYFLVNHVSTNPNITVTHGTWFAKWPSFFVGNNRAKCQSAMIYNMDTFFTNNTALTYTVVGITQSDKNAVLDSLEYNSNVLDDCAVSSVDVDLQGVTVRSSKQFAFTQWGAVTTAYIACNVNTIVGPVLLNLTTTYDYVLDETPLTSVGHFLGTGFVQRNKTASPNLWWGESLMSLHWDALSGTMEEIQNANTQGGDIILKGIISFTKTDTMNDIQNLDYFTIDYRFTLDMPDRTIGLIWPGGGNYTNSISELSANQASPNMWIQADNLVKSMYSTVLTDLGQASAPANILKEQETLRYFLSNASDTFKMAVSANAVPGPATRGDYINGTSIDILTPVIRPSVISASYLCQIPKRKSTGNLLVAIISADLVFLNALWLIFKLIVDHFFLDDQDHSFFRMFNGTPNENNSSSERDNLLGGGTGGGGNSLVDGFRNEIKNVNAGSQNSGTNKNYLSPYISQYSGISPPSASISTLAPYPVQTTKGSDGDGGYVLTTMSDVEVEDGSAGKKRGSQRPFQRRTSSSYEVLMKDMHGDEDGHRNRDGEQR